MNQETYMKQSQSEVRLFAALDIPEKNDQGKVIDFAAMQDEAAQLLPGFRPIYPLHVTLIFFGATFAHLIENIKKGIESSLEQFKQEVLGHANGISGLSIKSGADFMGKNAISITLIPGDLIAQLATYIEHGCDKNRVGYIPQRGKFVPHATIGRIKTIGSTKAALQAKAQELKSPIGARSEYNETFTARQVTLYKSLGHSEYEVLATFKL